MKQNKGLILLIANRALTSRDWDRIGLNSFKEQGWHISIEQVSTLCKKSNKNIAFDLINEASKYKKVVSIDLGLNKRTKGSYWKKVYILFLLTILTKRIILSITKLPDPTKSIEIAQKSIFSVCFKVTDDLRR